MRYWWEWENCSLCYMLCVPHEERMLLTIWSVLCCGGYFQRKIEAFVQHCESGVCCAGENKRRFLEQQQIFSLKQIQKWELNFLINVLMSHAPPTCNDLSSLLDDSAPIFISVVGSWNVEKETTLFQFPLFQTRFHSN